MVGYTGGRWLIKSTMGADRSHQKNQGFQLAVSFVEPCGAIQIRTGYYSVQRCVLLWTLDSTVYGCECRSTVG